MLEFTSQIATIISTIVALVLMVRAFYYGWLGKRLASADDLALFAQWELSSPDTLATEEMWHESKLERNADLSKPLFLSIRNNGRLTVTGIRVRVLIGPEVGADPSPLFEVMAESESDNGPERAYIFMPKQGVNLPATKQRNVYGRGLTDTQIGKFTVSRSAKLLKRGGVLVHVIVTADNLNSPAEFQLILNLPKQ